MPDSATLRQGFARGFVGEERLGQKAFVAGVVDALVGDLDQHLAQDAPVDGRHLLGTLRHDEVVGAVDLARQVAQRAHGHHFVVLDGTRGIDHQHVDLGLDVAVLEAVVHDDQVDFRMLGPDAADAHGTLLAHDDHRFGEL